MSALLSTKFSLPPLTESLVGRPRLLDRLDEGLDLGRLLTLVCAPAGYGKTTLLSKWLHARLDRQRVAGSGRAAQTAPLRAAWLTLDQGDNDLARFLTYLVAALQQIEPEIGAGMLAALRTPRPPSPSVLATWLVNDLARLTERIVLVLDDYHLITAQSVHDFLAFLVEHPPQAMRLVIASRADPALPLARLRAQGKLAELRQRELCLTLAEVQEFTRDVMGLALSAEQLALLERRTEGWIAGLQLAALSLRSVPDVPAFIEAFSGGHKHVADYLTDEVLAQQPAALQDFMLQTSLLERLSAPLCAAVTGQPDAQEVLEGLSKANLFLIPLDQGQVWYRYHPLFADLLRKRLHQTKGAIVNELHRRASRWYEDAAWASPAIEHALEGQDFERAARLIEQTGEIILMRGEAATLLGWLERLPEEWRRAQPDLVVLHVFALVLCGKPPDAAQQDLDEAAAVAGSGKMAGALSTFRGLLAIMRGQAGEAIRLSEKALQQLAPDQTLFRSLAADSLGMAYTLLGDSAAAIRAFEQVVAIGEQAGNKMMVLMALSNLAGLQVLRGQLRAAAASYQRVLEASIEWFGEGSPLTGKARLGLGMLAREWNDLEGAQQHYAQAAEMLGQSVEIGLPVAYLSLAMLQAARDDIEAAQRHIEKARQSARSSTLTQLDDELAEETQARLWILQGRLDLAEEWAQARGLLEQPIKDLLASQDAAANEKLLVSQQGKYLTLARLYLAQDRPDAVLETLEPLLVIFQENGHMRRVIEVLALRALALKQKGEADAALHSLSEALSLAEPEGYQRTFLDEGEPMAQLLYQLLAQVDYAAYARKLLAAYDRDASRHAALSEKGVPGEPLEALTARELDVLELIAEGLSNREIAERLHVTLSTVKGHARHIYGKLGVNRRTQAVAKARSLGLLAALER